MSRFIGDIAEEYSNALQSAFEAFKNVYHTSNPVPQLPDPKRDHHRPFLSWANWLLVMMLFKSMATIALSATRTGATFYSIAYQDSQNTTLAWTEMIAAIITIDIGIILYGVYRARKSYDSKRGKRYDINSTIVWVSIFLMILMMISAGIARALVVKTIGDMTNLKNQIEWALLFLMGGGVGILALLDGEIIGTMIGEWAYLNETIEDRYLQNCASHEQELARLISQYEAEMRASWEESEQYKQLNIQFRQIAKDARKSRVHNSVHVNKNMNTAYTGVDQAYDYLIEQFQQNKWDSPHNIPASRKIADILDIAPSSADKARKKILRELNGH